MYVCCDDIIYDKNNKRVDIFANTHIKEVQASKCYLLIQQQESQ